MRAKPFDIYDHRITVAMLPAPGIPGISGIHTVIAAYGRVFPKYRMDIVPLLPSSAHDISIVHAGMSDKPADISMLHGVYFTANYDASAAEWRTNEHIANSVRSSRAVTVPSDWVAETIRRDLRLNPVVIPHGVFYDDFQVPDSKYQPKTVFWGKNRIYRDVCDPNPLVDIARAMPDHTFIATMAPEKAPSNIVVVGLAEHREIKKQLHACSVVLSTVKETWGLLYAEAMACGVPVVTVNKGNVPQIVPHGVAGYAYAPGSIEDMVRGIEWCEENREILSRNAKICAQKLQWDNGVQKIRVLCEHILLKKSKENGKYNRAMGKVIRKRA